MKEKYLGLLEEKGILTNQHSTSIKNYFFTRPFSLFQELRALMYLGVILLTSGLGILIYKNIDTIGHTALIGAIALACGYCFYYAIRFARPFDHGKVVQINIAYDYILLSGCLLFLALEGYLQFQYNVFGDAFEIATLIPAILFLISAFRFDHIGVLSLGITSFISLAGLIATPNIISLIDDFSSEMVFTAIGVALLLIFAGWYLKTKNLKKHFTFTFYNFGFNLLLIALLTAQINFALPLLYFIILIAACGLLFRYAVIEKSFYFLLMSVVYAYISVTIAFFTWLDSGAAALYYFAISCAGVIYFFINYKKLFKAN